MGVLLFAGIVAAAPLYFAPGVTTVTGNSLATTSVKYMTPGAATTTTNVYDAYLDGTNEAANSAILLIQMTGSTTPFNASVATTTFNVALEYSQDNVDWYYNGVFATSTQLGWETSNGVLLSSTTPSKIFVNVPVPTRYLRAVISIPNGSTNGAVYAQLVPAKEQK